MDTTQTGTVILIPTPLRAYADGQSAVSVGGGTVGAALAQLVARHPALEPHLYDDTGRLRSFVNLYLGDEDVRYLQGAATPLPPGSELSIVPSIAGGAERGPIVHCRFSIRR